MLNPMRDKIKARTGGRRVDTCDHGLSRSSLRVKTPTSKAGKRLESKSELKKTKEKKRTRADFSFMVPSIMCRPVVAANVVHSDVSAVDFCFCHESAVLLPWVLIWQSLFFFMINKCRYLFRLAPTVRMPAYKKKHKDKLLPTLNNSYQVCFLL